MPAFANAGLTAGQAVSQQAHSLLVYMRTLLLRQGQAHAEINKKRCSTEHTQKHSSFLRYLGAGMFRSVDHALCLILATGCNMDMQVPSPKDRVPTWPTDSRPARAGSIILRQCSYASAAAHPGFQHPDIAAGSSSRSASRLRCGAPPAWGSCWPSRLARASLNSAVSAGMVLYCTSIGTPFKSSCNWARTRAQVGGRRMEQRRGSKWCHNQHM